MCNFARADALCGNHPGSNGSFKITWSIATTLAKIPNLPAQTNS
jgi:hypothetical protein